jgi:hypothetical protein
VGKTEPDFDIDKEDPAQDTAPAASLARNARGDDKVFGLSAEPPKGSRLSSGRA